LLLYKDSNVVGPLVLLLRHLVSPPDFLSVGQVRRRVRLPEEGLAHLGHVLLRRHLLLGNLNRNLGMREQTKVIKGGGANLMCPNQCV